MAVFCVVTPFALVRGSNISEEHTASVFRDNVSYYLQLLRWRQYVPVKHWYPSTSPHDVTTQKTSFDVFTVLIT
jgi:aspartate aminotransferase-like enzyme